MSAEHGAIMSPEREHIELFKASRIRINQDPVNREDFANSLQQIATGLYKAREHFIFELIQNADDNEYACEPKLSFTVKHVADNVVPCLVVTNTEKGFTQDHVIGICRVGKTTKKDKARYIGEKGIGFKSVFNVTHCPQIHSNGYHFCLPDTEHDVDAKLGFVVPYWVDPFPEGLSSEGTTILLPLKADCTEMICKKLKEFSPETIMFLRKIRNIEIKLDVDECQTCVEIERKRKRIRDREICLTECVDTCKRTTRYWMARRRFPVQPDFVPTERQGLTHREVTVALPLDSAGRYPGKLFAYLPIDEQTGLPFLVNADFLLVANREAVTDSTTASSKWNNWLKDCIAPVYVHAFLTGVQSSRLPIQDKGRLYESLPCNDAVYPFLAPVRQQIKELLKEAPCVLTVSGNPEPPGKCKRFKPEHKEWRSLLMEIGEAPEALGLGSMVVHAEIEGHGIQLKFLGVPLIDTDDIYKALADAEWNGKRETSWFVRLYKALIRLDRKDLEVLPILPIRLFDGGDRQCQSAKPANPYGAGSSHIYWRLCEEDVTAIGNLPAWARAYVPVAALDAELLDQIEALPEEEQDQLRQLLKKIGVRPDFGLDRYVSDILRDVGARAAQLTSEQVFELTEYLVSTDQGISNWEDLPVVLGDGSIMRVHDAQKSRPSGLVVPETYNTEAGWQHIWVHPRDRSHFTFLHNDYGPYGKSLFKKINAHDYPRMQRLAIYHKQECRTVWELSALNAAKAKRKRHDASGHIESCVFPAVNTPLTEATGRALVGWLNSWGIDLLHLEKHDLAVIGYYLDWRSNPSAGKCQMRDWCEKSPVSEWLRSNAWLPTTKGLCKPSDAYLSKSSIKEVFGDRISYFEGGLPPGAIKYLGIKDEITEATLIGELRQHSGSADADVGLLAKIYKQLEARGPSVKDAFSSSPYIAVRNATGTVTWHSVSECVWEDASDSAGDKFFYLEKLYPELKSFFVNVLGVRERVCADLYLDRLAALSQQCAQEIDEIGLIYQHLDYYGQDEVSPERFEREKLIAAKSSDGSLRWHLLSECVWETEAVFADMFGCLKQAHPALGGFFCSRLKVRERLELKDYLDCWVKLQDPSADPLTQQRKLVVESLYREIGLCLDRLDTEPFTSFFSKKPRVYTDKYAFQSGPAVYWPDDGQLKEVLSDEVKYAWLPDGATYEQWKGFFDKAGVRLLSQCVNVDMPEPPSALAVDANRYLTRQAVQLMATCIREKDGEAYQRLLKEGKFEQLVGTKEVNVEGSLKVRYTIASVGKKAESPVYWDSQNRFLYVIREDPKTLKRKIANHLALSLVDKSYDSDFETYLEEDCLDRLNDKSWKVPLEISAMFGSATPRHTEDQQMVAPVQPAFAPALQAPEAVASQPMATPHSAVDTRQSSGIPKPASGTSTPAPPPHPSVSVPPYRSSPSVTPVAKTEPADRPTFDPFEDAPGVESLEPSANEDPRGVIRNAERFGGVVSADARARLAAEPPPDERRRRSESDRLECSDPQVRTALLEYYGGQCQMCHRTFPKRDGEPYFVASHYIGREDGRYLDCVANAICLCADHFAKWQHAAKFFDEESEKRILEIDPNADDPVIRVRLAGIDETITYVPAHFAKLQALYREAGPGQKAAATEPV